MSARAEEKWESGDEVEIEADAGTEADPGVFLATAIEVAVKVAVEGYAHSVSSAAWLMLSLLVSLPSHPSAYWSETCLLAKGPERVYTDLR